ncbi:hypothetical protein Cgig2_028482 [Carnegiea gigantea]|uniref:Uncharacterized protein n=1 Tax=Carnegiea gigantea TaxID=171969 RepID=A0A9Q1GJS4_9CARY|nr:hypothetical protein Cgig2_028482 [Carnegiea gigantea]
MAFDGREGSHFTSPHNDPLVFEIDDGSIDKLQGNQRTARECYIVSIRQLIEHSVECGLAEPPPSDKKQRIALPSPAEALVVIIPGLISYDLLIITIIYHGLIVQRHGILSIAQTVFIQRGWYEVYQLRVLDLGTSLAVVFDVLNVHLEVAFLLKVIRGQGL